MPEFDHEFDGIRELDNRIPPGSPTSSSARSSSPRSTWLDYHVLGTSKLMEEEYREEVAAADVQRRILLATEGTIDETTLAALNDPEALKRGGEQFQKVLRLLPRAPGAGGVVGPNLTDDYWIHGGGIRNVYATIKTGRARQGHDQLAARLHAETDPGDRQLCALAPGVPIPPAAKKPEGTLEVEQTDTTADVYDGRGPVGRVAAERRRSFRDSLGIVSKEGKRRWIYPKRIVGRFYRCRTALSLLLLAVLFGRPFLRIDGHPFMLFNVLERKFILFGQVFGPHDFYLFGLASDHARRLHHSLHRGLRPALLRLGLPADRLHGDGVPEDRLPGGG